MLRTRTTICLAVLFPVVLAACGPLHTVATKEEAIAAAKTALAGLPEAAGPFEVVREGDVWMVSAKSGHDSSASVSINAKTGKAVRLYADDGTDLSVIKPKK